MFVTTKKEVAMFKRNGQRRNDDWNRRRTWNYEKERGKQAAKHLTLFLILSFVLALGFSGVGTHWRFSWTNIWSAMEKVAAIL